MNVRKTLFVALLSILLSGIAPVCIFTLTASAQTTDSRIALQKGYRTGYSDGYMAGYRDIIDSNTKDLSRHAEYIKADRAYNRDYGALQDYRDGYQQGFESGYATGFEKRSFEATLPADLKRRGEPLENPKELMAEVKPAGESQITPPVETAKVEPAAQPPASTTETAKIETPSTEPPPASAAEPAAATEPVQTGSDDPAAGTSDSTTTTGFQATAGNPSILIPRDTELILQMQNDLSTASTREGQRFTATIASPSELAGATVEGRVTKVRGPGRIKRRSELLLSFDRIVLNENRWGNFSAVLVEVIPVKGDNVSHVDNEGTAIGQSSFKQDAIKVGATTGAGVVVGAIAGGPVGAAVGAGIGAAFGVGAVVVDRGKHVRINRNQQVRVKTAFETQIR